MGIDQLQKSLQSGVVKYSAGFLAEGHIDDVNRVISSSFVFSLVLGVLAATGISIVALTWRLDGPDVTSSLYIVAGLMLFVVPLTPYLAIIQSCQCYYVGAIADTLSTYLSLGIVFAWFTWETPSVKALIIITAVILLLSRFAQVPIARRLVPGLRNGIALYDNGILRKIATFGGLIVLTSLVD